MVSRTCRSQTPLPTLGSKVFVARKSVGGGAIKDVKVVLDDRRDKPSPFDTWADKDKEEEEMYRGLGPHQIAKLLMRDDAATELGDSRGLESILDGHASSDVDAIARDAQRDMTESTRPLRLVQTPKRNAFWDDEEPDPDLITNDDTDAFDENDMTDVAHAKLEEIREERAYARTIVWEMPLLSSKCSHRMQPQYYDGRWRKGRSNASICSHSGTDTDPRLQNMSFLSSHQQDISPSDFGLLRTWANITQPRRKSLLSSVHGTLA